MKRFAAILAAFALTAARAADPAPAGEGAAALPPPPDTSGWTCRYCTWESGLSGWVEPSLDQVWHDRVVFSDYGARHTEGTYGDFAGSWRYRNPDTAGFLDAQVDRLALDSRDFDLAAGRQGRYRVVLGWHAVPYGFGDGVTPFLGDNPLTLPAGWTRGGSTQTMTDLPAALHLVTLEQRRDRLALGFDVMPRRALDVRVDFHRDTIHGTRALGASFMTLDSQLPRPLDQTIDRTDLSAAYQGAYGTAMLALNASSFTNDENGLYWQNPYNAPSPGADNGQLGLAPDNSAHRVSLTLGSAPSLPVQLTGQFALGLFEQDEPYLPATVNPNQSVALPRGSLNGRVYTTLATLRASYTPWHGVRLKADVLHDDRDNRTPVAGYTQVVMDTFTGATRVNVPYSFTRNRYRVSVEQVGAPRVAVGYDYDQRDRSLVTDLNSHEQTAWARVGWRPLRLADVHLRLAHARRDGADAAAGAIGAAENPLMRAFQASDRTRDELRGDVSVPVMAWGTASANVSYGRNRYPVEIGRTRERALGYGAELAAQPLENWTATVFGARDQMSSAQANSQAFAAADWFADQDDVTTTAGASVSRRAAKGLEVGADYVYSQFEGNVYLTSGTLPAMFPALVSRLQDTRLFAAYPVRPELTLRLDVLYQHYEGRDWQLDGVGPATIPNVLALGLGPGSGDAAAAILGFRYSFAPKAAEESGD